jgi:hypothetical protein
MTNLVERLRDHAFRLAKRKDHRGARDCAAAADEIETLWFAQDKRKRELQSAEIEKAEIKIAKLDYKPGDVVVVSTPGMISEATAKRLKQFVEMHLPGAKVLVFGDEVEIEIRQ